jgi:hypothetical protein
VLSVAILQIGALLLEDLDCLIGPLARSWPPHQSARIRTGSAAWIDCSPNAGKRKPNRWLRHASESGGENDGCLMCNSYEPSAPLESRLIVRAAYARAWPAANPAILTQWLTTAHVVEGGRKANATRRSNQTRSDESKA